MKLKKRALPSGDVAWRAVFLDLDTNRETYVTLDATALPSAEARRAWAITKSKGIARRRMELEGGAPRATGTKLEAALAEYFEAHKHLRDRTTAIYRTAGDKLTAWAVRVGVRATDDLTRAKLVSFRDELVRAPKRVPHAKGKRGGFKESRAPRSAAAVNQDLRAVRTVLGYLLDRDLLPKLSRDDLRRALKMAKATREAPEFLTPAECQKLVAAARKHDAARFAETREEHAGKRPVGSTARYESIAPFVETVLLTGMRFGEALALRWADVHLDAVNGDDVVVGEIRLRGGSTKTGHARTIGLDVSPSVRARLVELKAAAGAREKATGERAEYVFGGDAPLARGLAESSRKRLVAEFGAPEFTWQLLRSTCATVHCNAPSISGAAAAFTSAKRLGHSVAVSEKLYAGQMAVSKGARTLEAAMGIPVFVESE